VLFQTGVRSLAGLFPLESGLGPGRGRCPDSILSQCDRDNCVNWFGEVAPCYFRL
jgi:hypothetical protein